MYHSHTEPEDIDFDNTFALHYLNFELTVSIGYLCLGFHAGYLQFSLALRVRNYDTLSVCIPWVLAMQRHCQQRQLRGVRFVCCLVWEETHGHN